MIPEDFLVNMHWGLDVW